VANSSKVALMDDVKQFRRRNPAATRQRMLNAAYDLFSERGFRATTIAAIAERADVAVQTVYFTFHNKDVLLREVLGQIVMGPASLPPPEQSWYRAATAEPEPRRAIQHVVEGIAAILARVAPMLPVFHAVAGDTAGEAYRTGERLRWEGMRDLTRDVLLTKPSVRAGMELEHAVGLVFVLLGPEVYRSFVYDAGWSIEQWKAWTVDALVRDLYQPSH